MASGPAESKGLDGKLQFCEVIASGRLRQIAQRVFLVLVRAIVRHRDAFPSTLSLLKIVSKQKSEQGAEAKSDQP